MLLALGLAGVRPAVAQTTIGPIIRGWREAIVIVPDPAPWVETLTSVGGWEIAARSVADASLNPLWGLDAAARTEQVLMRNIGTQKGFIRLVRVVGADQRPIRPDDQAWETGGVSALDLRVLDIAATRTALHDRGWRAPSDPVRYKAYGVEVIQWAPVSPDGIRLSFIQRIAPKLVGWDELKRWSRAGNAAVITSDIAAAAAFWGNGLGLHQISHTNTVGGDGPNVMGLPWRFARQQSIDIRGFGASGDADSAVELIAMPQARGRDYAAAAHPPNLGIAGLRVRVADAHEAAARLAANHIVSATKLVDIDIAPYGPCQAFAVRGADGVWLEFFAATRPDS